MRYAPRSGAGTVPRVTSDKIKPLLKSVDTHSGRFARPSLEPRLTRVRPSPLAQMNFLVLEKVDAVTHGLINCGRRVANICFAIVWFGTAITLYNGIGITLALSGAYCYMKAKQASSRAAPSAPPAASSSPFMNANRMKSR